MTGREDLAILGAGAIGTAFAAAFMAAGHDVTLCDPEPAARDAAPEAVARHLAAIRRAALPVVAAPGALRPAAAVVAGMRSALVIEAGPERVEAKRAIFAELLAKAPDGAVLASASSAIPISTVLPDAAAQRRCLVAHPANPPSLIRVVELVPGPGTATATVERAAAIFRGAAFDSVILGREVPAFVFNRLQSALLREAYRLVDEGVVDVDGLDRLVRDGLGPRWALSGPFETADLNTAGGVRGHAERLGPAYAAIGAARGETEPHWSPALVDKVEAARRAVLPEADLPARRAWREAALADLLAARRGLFSEDYQW